jgi:hypothetical protein
LHAAARIQHDLGAAEVITDLRLEGQRAWNTQRADLEVGGHDLDRAVSLNLNELQPFFLCLARSNKRNLL